jgi:hypothetical protein
MKCSGSRGKCKCTEFQGTARKPGHCEGCRHDRDSHYDSSDDSGGDSDDDDPDNTSDDGEDEDNGDEDNEDDTTQPSTAKNKMAVSSLVANLIQDGEYSNTDVDTAKREAKAGLRRQQVCSMLVGMGL